MTDTSPAAGWIPSLESIKNVSWGSIGKWVVACLAVLLGWGIWAHIDTLAEWAKPAPAPAVVEYVPAAQFKALQAKVAGLESKGPDNTDGVSVAEFEALKARVEKVESSFGKRRRGAR